MTRYRKSWTQVIEEVILNEALKPIDKSVVDAFYYKKEKAGKVVSTDGDSLWKNGLGGQEIAIWTGRKIKITAVSDVKSTESIIKYIRKSIPSGILEEVEEGVTGPTRMDVQKHFDKEKGLLRVRINATEKALNISDMKVDAKGTVQSFKEEVELDEKWEVGVVYHQDFGGGEVSYFRADSLLKNRRWKGMAVDEYSGKQKKPRNITADEKTPGWEITPKNKIPKGLKEEVELDEHCGVCGEQGIDEKLVSKLKIKPKKVKKLKDLRLYRGKPAKKPAKGHGSYSKYSDTSGGFSFLKKGSSGSGYVGAYNSAELDGTEIKEDEVDEASLGSMISKKAKKLGKASSGYTLYHKDFSSAMQHAYDHAKKKGHVVDPKEIDDKVATGPKKPSKGKVNRYALKAGRKTVQIQVTNLDNKAYELNMYIEGVEPIPEGFKDLPPHLQKLVKKIEKKQKDWNKQNPEAKIQTLVYNPETGKPDIVVKETMKLEDTVKQILTNEPKLEEHCGVCDEQGIEEDSDKDEPGTQGDMAVYQKKRKEVAKKFGVKSCSELEGADKKACYAALDKAHVADHEEQVELEKMRKEEKKEQKSFSKMFSHVKQMVKEKKKKGNPHY